MTNRHFITYYSIQCEQVIRDKYSLKRHISVVHDHLSTVHGNYKSFQCKKCCKQFGCKENLKRHLKTVHENMNDFQCEEWCKSHEGNDLRKDTYSSFKGSQVNADRNNTHCTRIPKTDMESGIEEIDDIGNKVQYSQGTVYSRYILRFIILKVQYSQGTYCCSSFSRYILLFIILKVQYSQGTSCCSSFSRYNKEGTFSRHDNYIESVTAKEVDGIGGLRGNCGNFLLWTVELWKLIKVNYFGFICSDQIKDFRCQECNYIFFTHLNQHIKAVHQKVEFLVERCLCYFIERQTHHGNTSWWIHLGSCWKECCFCNYCMSYHVSITFIVCITRICVGVVGASLSIYQ